MMKPSCTAGRFTAAISCAFLAVALASCSTGPDDTSKAGQIQKLVSQLPTAKGPVEHISWNLTLGEPTTLDPRNSATYSSGQVVSNLCDSLLRKDAEFGEHPNLAEAEQTSPTQVTIKLREGARFWDGSPVTTSDVVYSLNRAADPVNSIVAFVFASVSSIAASRDDTVVVTFKEPDATFLPALSTIAGSVVQQKYAESVGDAFGSSSGGLMCSGPFKLDSWKSGSGIKISANPDYWNKELKPLAQKVDFSFITDTTAVAQALNSGEIDGSYELPPSIIPTLRNSSKGQLTFGPSTQTFGLTIAGPGGVLRNQDLRLALQKALDRDAIAKVVFEGAATPSYTLLSTTTWPNESASIYQEAYPKWERERSFDIAAAKKLVEKSGYDGSRVVLGATAGNETENKMAQLVQQQAKQIGIEIEIRQLQPLTAAQAAYDATAREGLDLLIGASFNSSKNPLEPLFFSVLPGQPYNTTEFDDPKVTDLLYQARREFDAKKQATLLTQAQEIYEQANPSIPLVEIRSTTFLNNRLSGAVTSFAYWSMPQMAFIGSAQ